MPRKGYKQTPEHRAKIGVKKKAREKEIRELLMQYRPELVKSSQDDAKPTQ